MRAVILTLLKANSSARLRRLRGAFATPRRCGLSLLVILLAFVWTGQTVASVLFREPWAPDEFRRWVAVPLFAWFMWHLLRVAWKRPEAAIEWSDEEQNLIVGGPLTPQQQLFYRVVVILSSTLPKAILTILILWPNLSWSSPLGLVMALIGLELFRMVMDIWSSCLSETGYRAYRCSMVVLIVGLMFFCRQSAVTSATPATTAQLVQLARSLQPSHIVDGVLHNPTVAVLAMPMTCVADVVSAHGSVGSLLLKCVGMFVVLLFLAALINRLHDRWLRIAVRREQEQWKSGLKSAKDVIDTAHGSLHLPNVSLAGPLVWRQWKRALRYRGSLVVSMAIPVVLLIPTLIQVPDPTTAFLLVVASALFYTFVLLPEAIKFDFRLDSDHLSKLKMLPMSPTRVVLGQLATPILLSVIFQVAVYSGAGIYRGVEPILVIVCLGLSVPLTILFVAFDNLTFLLYPQRPTQEGFKAFLRTILKFTGKCVFLGVLAGSVIVWAPTSAVVAELMPNIVAVRTVFLAGVIIGLFGFAAASVGSVIAAFRRFDVSLHTIS